MKNLTNNLPLILPFLLAACTGSSHMIGEHDAGMTDDGGGGGPCGSTTCGAGQVCCNASCGICLAPGESCITLLCADGGPAPDGSVCIECAAPPPGCDWVGGDCSTCGTLVCDGGCGGDRTGGGTCEADEYCDYTDGCGFADEPGTCRPRPDACTADCPGVCGCDGNDYCNTCTAAAAGVDVLHDGPCTPSGPCDAQDAHGDGPCPAFFGYRWNGAACEALGGCSCTGSDCGSIFSTMEECDAAYAHCGGDTCGTIAGLTCSGSEWCDYPDGSYCGGDDSGGVCRPRPMACADIWAPVCACDGSTYGNECSAHAAGQDVVSTGECETTPATDCRTTGCPMGQHCDACLAAGGVEYACIPDGAAC